MDHLWSPVQDHRRVGAREHLLRGDGRDVQRGFPLDQSQVSPCAVFHTHTNLVLRESLDFSLHHLLLWDIEIIIDESVDESEEEPEV